jgi:hypothetical protein
MVWRAVAARRSSPPGQEGFLLPMSMLVALLLMLSSLMLLTLALQSRLQAAVQRQRRQAEDQLMSAAQQWAGDVQRDCPQALVGEPLCAGLDTGVGYRLVSYEPGGGPEHGTGELVLELTGRDPAPRAAFALHWRQSLVQAPESEDFLPDPAAPPRLVGIEERGLRGADS